MSKSKKRIATVVGLVSLAVVCVVGRSFMTGGFGPLRSVHSSHDYIARQDLKPIQLAVLNDAEKQTQDNILYANGYYVNGDPPANRGVCADVIIRSYRVAGVALKNLVNDDIRQNPRSYHIARPDPNIDYRRTRNLDVYFHRHAIFLPVAGKSADWQPADIVIFSTRGNGYADHIGIVADGTDEHGNPTLIQHLPGRYVLETSFIGLIPILHHYRWVAKT